MPSNIEIKAYARDWDRLQAVAEQLGGPLQVIRQEDIFFHCQAGRLKLRVFSPASGELIHYHRPDQAGPKTSDYRITPTADPAGLKTVLAGALGVRGVVRKQRHLYLAGQTRIHLDEVEGLGRFIELEVVLQPGQTAEQGRQIAAERMRQLGIAPDDLLTGAYIDMIDRLPKPPLAT